MSRRVDRRHGTGNSNTAQVGSNRVSLSARSTAFPAVRACGPGAADTLLCATQPSLPANCLGPGPQEHPPILCSKPSTDARVVNRLDRMCATTPCCPCVRLRSSCRVATGSVCVAECACTPPQSAMGTVSENQVMGARPASGAATPP